MFKMNTKNIDKDICYAISNSHPVFEYIDPLLKTYYQDLDKDELVLLVFEQDKSKASECNAFD